MPFSSANRKSFNKLRDTLSLFFLQLVFVDVLSSFCRQKLQVKTWRKLISAIYRKRLTAHRRKEYEANAQFMSIGSWIETAFELRQWQARRAKNTQVNFLHILCTTQLLTCLGRVITSSASPSCKPRGGQQKFSAEEEQVFEDLLLYCALRCFISVKKCTLCIPWLSMKTSLSQCRCCLNSRALLFKKILFRQN